MELILESHDIQDYLKPDKYIDFHADVIIQKADELFNQLTDETAKIEAVFEFVRDEISHSGDIDSERVTKSASEALIC